MNITMITFQEANENGEHFILLEYIATSKVTQNACCLVGYFVYGHTSVLIFADGCNWKWPIICSQCKNIQLTDGSQMHSSSEYARLNNVRKMVNGREEKEI